MQIPHIHAPVIFLAKNVHPQRSAGREVHGIGIRRNIFLAEERSAAQLKVRRESPVPFEIPLQSQRIESPSICRIRRLKNQIHRNKIHHIFKPPPQNPRPVRTGQHPPIAHARIKSLSKRSPARHRVPSPRPYLHFVRALFRRALRPAHARHSNQKNTQEKTREEEKNKPVRRSHAIEVARLPPILQASDPSSG